MVRGDPERAWNPLWPSTSRGTQQQGYKPRRLEGSWEGSRPRTHTHTYVPELLRVTLGLAEPRREEAEAQELFRVPPLPGFVQPSSRRDCSCTVKNTLAVVTRGAAGFLCVRGGRGGGGRGEAG